MQFNHFKKINLNPQIKPKLLYTNKLVKLHLTRFHDADVSDGSVRKYIQLSIPVQQLCLLLNSC